MEVFKTKCQTERELQDYAVYSDYERLASIPGQSKTEIVSHLMEKYHFHAPSTIYVIRKRVEERLKKGGSNEQQA